MIEIKTDGFQQMIDTLDRMDIGKEGEGIIKKALNSSIEIVKKAIVRRAPVYKGPAKKGVIPGLLKANILVGKVRKLRNGAYSQVVGPTKGDISKVWYGKLSEFGSSNQPAKPFIRPGFDESKDAAYEDMKTVLLDGIETSFNKK